MAVVWHHSSWLKGVGILKVWRGLNIIKKKNSSAHVSLEVLDALYLPIPDQSNPSNANALVIVPQVTAKMQWMLGSRKKIIIHCALLKPIKGLLLRCAVEQFSHFTRQGRRDIVVIFQVAAVIIANKCRSNKASFLKACCYCRPGNGCSLSVDPLGHFAKRCVSHASGGLKAMVAISHPAFPQMPQCSFEAGIDRDI